MNKTGTFKIPRPWLIFGGRVVAWSLGIVAITLLTGWAAMQMGVSSDGVQNWLEARRWGLLAWRVLLYAAIAGLWRLKVRPLVLKRTGRGRVIRLEIWFVALVVINEVAVNSQWLFGG